MPVIAARDDRTIKEEGEHIPWVCEPDLDVVERYQHGVVHPSLRQEGVDQWHELISLDANIADRV